MNRTRADGVTLAWSVLYDPALGEAVPFLIKWGDSPHSSGTPARGWMLRSFAALQPDPEPLRRLYAAALGVPVDVKRAPAPGFIAVLDTPRGEVVLGS